ncbi:MAG: hypothetical protein PHU63_04250, partial [Candidatus ainarchaeum sp.]|nr:hypothetical protein [Candidatus ainarchaeum sp.]
ESSNVEFIFVSVGYLGEENNYTLEEILDAGIENSKQTMPDLELINNVDKEGNYFRGKEIKFTGTSEGIKRNFTQFFGIEYNNIYSITYSCPIDECDYYPIYESFVMSFEPVESEKN